MKILLQNNGLLLVVKCRSLYTQSKKYWFHKRAFVPRVWWGFIFNKQYGFNCITNSASIHRLVQTRLRVSFRFYVHEILVTFQEFTHALNLKSAISEEWQILSFWGRAYFIDLFVRRLSFIFIWHLIAISETPITLCLLLTSNSVLLISATTSRI